MVDGHCRPQKLRASLARHAHRGARSNGARPRSHRSAPAGPFVLHHQPVLDLPSTDLLGFEALIRWQHPERGLVPPADFIGLAEDSGDIVGIGAWVLDEACAVLARNQDYDPELMIFVNISPRQLAAPEFADEVIRTLDRHGLAPQHVVLEITEAIAMTDTEAGLPPSPPCVSTGSMSHSTTSGPATPRCSAWESFRWTSSRSIDRSFITSRNPHVTSTLRSIIELAQGLGLRIVAEGIEDPEDLEGLRAFGNIAGQGYLFARPMPELEAFQYVQDHAPVRNPATP